MTTTEQSRMRVVVRIRPLSNKEIKNEEETVICQLDDKALVFDPANEDEEEHLRDFHKIAKLAAKKSRGSLRRKKNSTYCFDAVFGPDSTQEDVYNETTADTVETVFNGYNCSVFAYGATGAGKTHTMLGNQNDPGVIARTVEALYRKVETMKETNQDTDFKVDVQYLEVYNEKINDLLIDGKKGKDLPLREADNGVIIAGLTQRSPNDASQLMEMLSQGNNRRTQHPTDANAQSSRSHAVFMVNLTSKQGAQITKSKLTLVDLAGSERATATTNMGKRLQEGGNINRSLLALGNVINALADPKHKGHIKYRDSKLTRLLKDSLGGTCRTVMIANVSPADSVYEDTLNTIKYADRAKSIRSDLKKRVIERNIHVGKYKEVIGAQKKQIQRLEQELAALRKEKPKKKDEEINPIWDTLLNVILDVTRIKGEMRTTRLEKFIKQANFDVKQTACAPDESPGTNRNERVLSAFDAKCTRQQEQVDALEKQIKSLAPIDSRGLPPLINWRRCAEHHQQRSKNYEDQIAKLYSMVNDQTTMIKNLAASSMSSEIKEILNPTEMSVKFGPAGDADSCQIPEFLRIPVGDESELLRPLSSLGRSNGVRSQTVTRSALKNSKSAFKSARRPLDFNVASKTPKTPEFNRPRKLTKSRSETQMRDKLETESRPKTAEVNRKDTKIEALKKELKISNKENISIPPSQRRKRQSDGTSDNDSPTTSKKQKVSPKAVPSYMKPTAVSRRRDDIHHLKELKKQPSKNAEKLRALREKLRK